MGNSTSNYKVLYTLHLAPFKEITRGGIDLEESNCSLDHMRHTLGFESPHVAVFDWKTIVFFDFSNMSEAIEIII